MKKLLLLALPISLLLVGCRGENPHSSNSEINSNQPTTSENTNSSLWNSTTKQNLMSIVGEEIPYVQLGDGYTSSIESDEEGYFVYISDESNVNLLTNYGNVLAMNGYTFYSSDTESGYEINFYYKERANDVVYIQYDFYPGNEEYSAGNEIYVWTATDDGNQGGGNTDIESDWDDLTVENSLDVIGEVIPYVALASNYQSMAYTDDYGDYVLYVYDETSNNLLTNYGNTLEANGYEFYSSDNEYGYEINVYSKDTSNGTILVQYDFYPGDEEYAAGNEIYAWIDGGNQGGDDEGGYDDIEKSTSTTFPSSAINAYINGVTSDQVPSFESSEYKYYNYNGKFMVEGLVSSDITSSYKVACENAGYTVTEDEDAYGLYYVAINEDETLEIVFYVFDYEGLYFYLEITAASNGGGNQGGSGDVNVDTSSQWNESTQQALLNVVGEIIPFVALASDYESGSDTDEDGDYVYICDTYMSNLLVDYGNTLVANGYQLYGSDNSNGYEDYLYYKDIENGTIYVEYFFFPGDDEYYSSNMIYVWLETSGDSSSDNGNQGNDGSSINSTNKIDMSSMSHLVEYDNDHAVWVSAKATFVITKNGAELNVGNTSYYYNPCRVYTGQKITISWDEGNAPTSIVITCQSNKYANVIASSTLSGCTANNDDVTVTLTNLSNNCTIVVSGQTRITSVEFIYE